MVVMFHQQLMVDQMVDDVSSTQPSFMIF